MSKKKAADNAARRIILYEAEEPTGNTKDVKMLIGFLKDDPDRLVKAEAYEALKKIKGEGIDAQILDEFRDAKKLATRKQLAQVLSTRKYSPAFGILSATSKAVTKETDKLLFLSAAEPLATAEDASKVIEGFDSKAHNLRHIYENTLVSIINKSSNPEPILTQVRQGVKSATGDKRRSMYRVLGTMGDSKTELTIDKALKGSDLAGKLDALTAYMYWPTREPIEKVAKVANTKDKTVQRQACRAYGVLSGKPAPIKIDQYIADWQRGFTLMQDQSKEMQKMMTTVIPQSPHPQVLAMLEGWQKHPKYGPLAKSVANSMKGSLKKIKVMSPGKELKGSTADFNGSQAGVTDFLQSITGWTSPNTSFSWSFKVKDAGTYSITVLQADLSSKPSDFVVYLNGQTFKGKSSKTTNLEDFKPVKLPGNITLQANQICKLCLVAGEKVQPRMMDIGAIVFEKK